MLPLRALNRFGLGARPGEVGRMRDPKSWLREQLDGGPPVLAGAPPDDDVLAAFTGIRRALQSTREERQEARRRLREVVVAEERALMDTLATTDRPFVERLVAFWSNHLAISTVGKIAVNAFAGAYERRAIRPHVLGRFDDMVLASAKHPAMLIYLDNERSIGPNSTAATMAARRRAPAGGRLGLNENYARELLELHTLGVDGGYTQEDVQELAKILTGWTVAAPGRPMGPVARAAARRRIGVPPADSGGPFGFAFDPARHEPGAKTLLGTRYPASGVEAGESAIRALCAHPSTATFVARKLVSHFVADDPPAAAVDRIARVFRETDGDLRRVADALIDVEEAWADGPVKFRTPRDWLVAVVRGTGLTVPGERLAPMLRQLRQPLWSPPSPAGFGDRMAEWADPDSLLNRAELARTLGPRVAAIVGDPRALLELVDVPPGDPMRSMLADASIPAPERFALGLASPAFQWR